MSTPKRPVPLSRSGASAAIPPAPWWRFGMVWLVIAGPVSVVVASVVSAVIAWRTLDVLIEPGALVTPLSSVQAQAVGDDPTHAPPRAQRGRAHAAVQTPSP